MRARNTHSSVRKLGGWGTPTCFHTGTASRGVTKSTPHTLVLQKARLALWEGPDQFPHRTSCWLRSVTQSTLHTLVCQKTRFGVGGRGGGGRPVCTAWTAASCGVLCGPHVLHALVQQFSRFQVCGNPAWLHTGIASLESRGPCAQHALVTLSSIRKARLEVCEGNRTWLHTGTANHGVMRSMHATRTRPSESEA